MVKANFVCFSRRPPIQFSTTRKYLSPTPYVGNITIGEGYQSVQTAEKAKIYAENTDYRGDVATCARKLSLKKGDFPITEEFDFEEIHEES